MLHLISRSNVIYRTLNPVSGFLMFGLTLIGLITLNPSIGFSQEESDYDEISVFLNVQRVGGAEVAAVIRDETVFLPVVDIFSFLKIKADPSEQLDSVTGFFINQQATYSISRINNRITYQGKVFQLESGDMIKTETNLYLKSSFFGQIFGLDCVFSFRSLSVLLSTKIELPIIRDMRQEQMRANISQLKGEVEADTIIGRSYPLVHFGMADWSVISTQELQGLTDTRLNLALGSVIAGGEANVVLNYNNNTPFREKQQQYLWRFVNNDRPFLRQVIAGKIYTPVTSSIYDPIVGIKLTNTPTTYRRSFGTYTLSDITEPNWTVELYVNNVLVDYMSADASGFYKFEVPLVYGNSAITLKFFGPWGEERIKEENISIPFNFLPPKELEYTLSAGIVEDTLRSRFTRATLNYGISRRFTAGGGLEYLSSVKTGPAMPFVSASYRVLSGLLLSGEYTYAVRVKGLLSYRLPSNLQFELNYTKYEKGQQAIIYNYLEERKAVVSIPIKGKNFSAYSRLTLNQIVLPNLKNTNAEMLLSGTLFGVSTNFTTYCLYTDLSDPYVYSNLSLAFRLPMHLTVTPQVQYEYNSGQLISARANLEKPLFKHGFLNMSFEQNFRSHSRSIEFGFRYDFSFAQSGLSVRNSNNQTTIVESARGSLLYDRKTRYLGSNNRTNVGKGAITILPFLDVNGNGLRDRGEPKAAGLQFRVNGGTIIRNEKDTTIRILDLTPYTSYLLELDKNSFDNIAWQLNKLTMKITIDPNQLKTIEVPVAVMAEVAGTVYRGSEGLGRILVCIYRGDSILVARTLSESDGYYSYLGLKPGSYTVRIDREQLKTIRMKSSPEVLKLNVTSTEEGDIFDGVDFYLSSSEETGSVTADTLSLLIPEPEPVDTVNSTFPSSSISEHNAALTIPDVLPEESSPVPGKQAGVEASQAYLLKGMDYQVIDYEGDAVQFCASRNKFTVIELQKKLNKVSGKSSIVVFEDGLYKLRIVGFSSRILAREFASGLAEFGFQDPYILVVEPHCSVQIGVYDKEEDAMKALFGLSERYRENAVVIFRNQIYQLRINGIYFN